MSEPREDPPDPVGTVSEEAVKLFGALSDWAREHGPEVGHGLSGLADSAAAAAREAGEHVDARVENGPAECAWCPLCRAVHVVRLASPEVRTHLATAASSLLQAAAGVLAAAGAEAAAGSARPHEPGVEHIDLDDDPEAGAAGEQEDDA